MQATGQTAAPIHLRQGEAEIRSRDWTVDESYAYCARLTKSHYENFPVGSILVPARLRKHFYSIYSFARTADDFADEEYGGLYSAEQRLGWLAGWSEELRLAFDGQARHPIFIALARTAEECRLPISLFEDLISAFSQDVTVTRYSTYEDLVDYCRRSANPVGRLILLLFGYQDAHLHAMSDEICTGLQLANHWQDVGIDLDKDRVYLPLEDLDRFGMTVNQLSEKNASPTFKEMMSFQVKRAARHFDRGKPLCREVRGRLALELKITWLGGSTILDMIKRNDYDVFEHRPVITTKDKVRLLARAIAGAGF